MTIPRRSVAQDEGRLGCPASPEGKAAVAQGVPSTGATLGEISGNEPTALAGRPSSSVADRVSSVARDVRPDGDQSAVGEIGEPVTGHASSRMGKQSAKEQPPRVRPCEKGSSVAFEPRSTDAERRANPGVTAGETASLTDVAQAIAQVAAEDIAAGHEERWFPRPLCVVCGCRPAVEDMRCGRCNGEPEPAGRDPKEIRRDTARMTAAHLRRQAERNPAMREVFLREAERHERRAR